MTRDDFRACVAIFLAWFTGFFYAEGGFEMLYQHIDGKFYGYAYDGGAMVEVDEMGNMVQIIVDQDKVNEIEEGMEDSLEHEGE